MTQLTDTHVMTTGPVRIRWPSLFQMTGTKQDATKLKYRCRLILPPNEVPALNRAIQALVARECGGVMPAVVHMARCEDKSDVAGGFPGGYTFNCTTDNKPSVLVPDGNGGMAEAMQPDAISDGDWVRAIFHVYVSRSPANRPRC